MVSGYPTSINFPQVDGLSTDSWDLGRHTSCEVYLTYRDKKNSKILQKMSFALKMLEVKTMQENIHQERVNGHFCPYKRVLCNYQLQ